MLGWLEGLSNRVLRFNPCVMQHDLRLRMRGRSVFWLMLTFVVLCSCAAAIPFVLWAIDRAVSPSGPDDALTEVGRVGMLALGSTILVLSLLSLPAWAGSAIAGERERHTLAVLRSTMLTASDIALGKFAATLTYAILLLAVSLPVAAWCMMLGAVAPVELAVIYAILLSFALCIAGIGTWMSALCRTTIGAVVSTYVVLIGVFGTVLIAAPLHFRLTQAVWYIIGTVVTALVWVAPVAITGWAVAALVRWLVMRAGYLKGERAQAAFAVVIFALVVAGLASLDSTGALLEHADLRDTALINPLVGLSAYLTEDHAPWATVWVSTAIAIAGCMGACRCLRLREFNPVYVEDIFINAWRRIRSRRGAPAEEGPDTQVTPASAGNRPV